MNKAHIVGEHLLLPGYGDNHPTLEIFSYDEMKELVPAEINRPGIAHLAFEVDDVKVTLEEIIKNYKKWWRYSRRSCYGRLSE